MAAGEFGRLAEKRRAARKGLNALKHFQIRKGEAPLSDPPPGQQPPADTVEPSAVALLGDDTPGLRPRFLVGQGDRVRRGQALFCDRRHPDIVYVSPVSGTVTETAFAPRRMLSICTVAADDEPDDDDASPPDAAARAAPRATLLSRGLWPAFRARPFGLSPAPETEPHAILVNAVQAAPQAPDPAVVLAGQRDAFAIGLKILLQLTEGPVHVCQSPGDPLGPSTDRIIHASFAGTRAAGLDGTQIDRLCPVDGDGQVWSIGYQDVAAIGHLFETGKYAAHRVVSITGPAEKNPRLVRTRLGARIADLCSTDGVRARSGDPRGDRDAAYLGRHDVEVTLVETRAATPALARGFHLPTGPSALIPTRALERALGVDLLAVPLLRALSVGDTDTARRLGCLSLVEEDLAALSRQCTSRTDYGVLLRRMLDDLMAEVA